MKLPQREELCLKDHLLMWEYDWLEWHADVNTGISVSYKIRLNRLLDIVIKYANGKSVLDIGCAQGNLALLLAERGFKVIATDINLNFLTYSRLKYEFGNINYVASDALNIPFKCRFDVIVITEILEHLAEPKKLISAIKKLLNPGGIAVITTPNGNYLFSCIHHYAQGQRNLPQLVKRQCGPGVESHLFHFTSEELLGIFREEGFRILDFEFLNTIVLNRRVFALLKMFLPLTLIKKIESLILKIKGLNKFLAYQSLLVVSL